MVFIFMSIYINQSLFSIDAQIESGLESPTKLMN